MTRNLCLTYCSASTLFPSNAALRQHQRRRSVASSSPAPDPPFSMRAPVYLSAVSPIRRNGRSVPWDFASELHLPVSPDSDYARLAKCGLFVDVLVTVYHRLRLRPTNIGGQPLESEVDAVIPAACTATSRSAPRTICSQTLAPADASP
jgi:hypothetical protein